VIQEVETVKLPSGDIVEWGPDNPARYVRISNVPDDIRNRLACGEIRLILTGCPPVWDSPCPTERIVVKRRRRWYARVIREKVV